MGTPGMLMIHRILIRTGKPDRFRLPGSGNHCDSRNSNARSNTLDLMGKCLRIRSDLPVEPGPLGRLSTLQSRLASIGQWGREQ